jgi:non-specific serine/threonine protein kinase
MTSSESDSFRELLHRYRVDRGLTQEELASRSGLSTRTISDLERGEKTRPHAPTVDLIAKALKLSAVERDDLEAARRRGDRGVGSRSQSLSPEPDISEPYDGLPVSLTPFVGRETEVARIKQLLARSRLVTLIGPGGCGKTRLALQVASELYNSYPQHVKFVDFQSVSDAAVVPETVARALDLSDAAGQSVVSGILRSLGAKHILLIFDNCEHLLEASGRIVDAILSNCPRVTILVTSRAPLAIAGEARWRVPSLRVPQADAGSPIDQVLQYDAIRLFVERAQAVDPEVELNAQNKQAVIDICRRLDGMPLAIELVAARVSAMAIGEIAARMDNVFRMLSGGSRSADPRQQTLQATLNWSYDLLGDDDKALFCRLSVFKGGFTLEAAEVVGAAVDLPRDAVFSVLVHLVDNSLVNTEKSGEMIRYSLLETIRQYAQNRLDPSEAMEAQRQHARYYHELTERLRPQLVGIGQADALEQLEIEHDNVRSALRWALEWDLATAARLGANLWRFWWQRGYFREGRRWLDEIVGRVNAAGETLTPSALSAGANALVGAGMLAVEQGEFLQARSSFEQSEAMSREGGDEATLALALLEKGALSLLLGEPAGPIEAILRESHTLCHRLGARRNAEVVQLLFGRLAARERDTQHALDVLGAAADFFRQTGDRWTEGLALWELAGLAIIQGNSALAGHYYTECLSIARSIRNQHGLAFVLLQLGRLAALEGDFLRARSMLEESLQIFRDIGSSGSYHALTELGVLASDEGDHTRAVALIAAGATSRPIHGPFMSATFLPGPEEAAQPALDRARGALGDAAFAAAWARGKALTLDQASTFALSDNKAT